MEITIFKEHCYYRHPKKKALLLCNDCAQIYLNKILEYNLLSLCTFVKSYPPNIFFILIRF